MFVGTQDDGILVSRNGGQSWNGSNAGLLDLCVEDIALSPAFSEDGIAFAATADGLYRTRNGGEAWRQVDVDGNDDFFDAVAVSPDFAEDRLVLVSSVESGLFRSEDGGRTWSGLELGEDVPDDYEDEFSQDDPGDVSQVALWSAEDAVVCSELGVALSKDGGDTWSLHHETTWTRGVRYASSAVHLDAAEGVPSVLLVGTARDGVVRSEDGGGSWSSSSIGLLASLISELLLAPDGGGDRALYVVSLDGQLRRSTDGGQTWSTSDAAIAPDDDEPALENDDEPDRTIHAQAVIPSPDAHIFLSERRARASSSAAIPVIIGRQPGAVCRPQLTPRRSCKLSMRFQPRQRQLESIFSRMSRPGQTQGRCSDRGTAGRPGLRWQPRTTKRSFETWRLLQMRG